MDHAAQRVKVKPGKAKPAPPWSSQPFRNVPLSLHGIKPAPGSTEPWVYDHTNRKGDFEDMDVLENATVIELDDGGDQIFNNKKKDGWDSSSEGSGSQSVHFPTCSDQTEMHGAQHAAWFAACAACSTDPVTVSQYCHGIQYLWVACEYAFGLYCQHFQQNHKIKKILLSSK